MKEWYDKVKPERTTRMVELKCGTCGNTFIRQRRLTHLSKSENKSTYCSSSCSGKQLSKSEVIREFYKESERTLNWKVDKNLGYVYSLHSLHPNADVNGKLYQHHYVMSKETGEPIPKGYVVHHKDRNRSNNLIENLQLLTEYDHIMLHKIEDKGYDSKEVNCECCGVLIKVSKIAATKYCSAKCSGIDKRKFNPSKEELTELLWTYPMTKISKMVGVSNVAINRRVKLLGIEKPPTGYWLKVGNK